MKLSGRLLAGLALQVAQDDDRSVLVGQATEFLVEQRLQLVPGVLLLDGRFGHGCHLLLARLPFGGRRPGLERRLVSHPVQPVRDLLAVGDGRRLAHQHQEGRLKGVLGIVVTTEDPAADSPDHRAVTMHQGGERGLCSAADVRLQQLPVRQARYITG
jgi:hypothetical protein